MTNIPSDDRQVGDADIDRDDQKQSFFDQLSIGESETVDGTARSTVLFHPLSALWTVNGGYIGAAILRCIEQQCSLAAPTALSINFINAITPGDAFIELTNLVRRDSSVGLFDCRIMQNDKLRVIASAWAADSREGPELRAACMPEVPHPDELVPLESLSKDEKPRPPFWSVFEERQINGIDKWSRENRRPRTLRWMRYRNLPDMLSTYGRAGLTLPIIDMLGVPAASNAYGRSILTSLAPTIQLSAHFYDLDACDGWLLGDAYAESVSEGQIHLRVRIWSINGRLVAQGMSQMLLKSGDGLYVHGKT